MKYKLFIDMDGVLSDFDTGAKNMFNFETNHFNVSSHLLDEDKKLIKKNFWSKVRENTHFWTDLPLMPGALNLWDLCCNFNPTVLTAAPSSFVEGSADFLIVSKLKEEWIKEKFIFNHQNNFVCTTSLKKHLFISKNHQNILIDDREDNIQRWVSHGGIGILHINFENTKLELQKITAPKQKIII